MSRLHLSIACGDDDGTRALEDGPVGIDGVDPVDLTLAPEEMFFRAVRNEEFDVTELSLSSDVQRLARGPLGEDSWSCGVAGNERTLEAFLRHHHAQGLSTRLVALGELFHHATHESCRI
jgi:hypothetical protein